MVKCGEKMGTWGIYASEAQGNIDWSHIKNKGIVFALVCAGWGAGEIDVQFRKNAKGCRAVEIPMAVCWISYAATPEEARREAEYCVETIEEFAVTYPVCFAFTGESVRYAQSRGFTMEEAAVRAIKEAFCGRMNALGYSAICCAGPKEAMEQFGLKES